jgi:hypothetical protein
MGFGGEPGDVAGFDQQPGNLDRPGPLRPVPRRAQPDRARTGEGLVVYRFGTSLYYANASRLIDDVMPLVGHGAPLRWLVLDCAAIGDIDYTAAAVLSRVIEHLRKRRIRLAVSSVLGPVREQRRGATSQQGNRAEPAPGASAAAAQHLAAQSAPAPIQNPARFIAMRPRPSPTGPLTSWPPAMPITGMPHRRYSHHRRSGHQGQNRNCPSICPSGTGKSPD